MKYKNAYAKKGIFFKTRPPFEQMPNRSIVTNQIDYDTCTNIIKTSKYTTFNFLPINLFYQFSKIANLYFLMIGVMQMIPEISISGGMPVIFMPLSLVIIVSAIKDLLEDNKRKKSDEQLNNMQTLVLTPAGYTTVKWHELRLGQIIKVKQNEQVPADIILLQSTQDKHNCFIETKNLDGETNLKYKNIQYDLSVNVQKNSENELFKQRIQFFYQRPNPYIYTFSGRTTIEGKTIGLDSNNVVLRGCTLRITKYITGVVIYTGYDTKIMLNSNKTRQKKSRLEFKMGIIVAVIFFTQMILTFLSALLAATWSSNFLKLYDYLRNNVNFLYKNEVFTRWGSWILLFTNFVPISLIVSLQMVKFVQGIFISKFVFSTTKPSEIIVQSSNLNEQLGQIEHFFSDKTGTLTCNCMNFKYMVVNGKTYGDGQQLSESQKQQKASITNVEFQDRQFLENLKKDPDLSIVQYLLCMSLCHSVIVEEEDHKIKYNASSPDELAFINFTRFCGFSFKGINKHNQMVIEYKGKELKYKLLHVIEFNSDRKMMSVILEKDTRIVLYSKGADNKIIEKLKNKNNNVLAQTEQKLLSFSVQGLRTLLFAKKQIQRSYYEEWAREYVNALTKLETVEEQQKQKIKQQANLKNSRKAERQTTVNKIKIPTNLAGLGNAIIEADINEQEQPEQIIIPTDNLLLTQNQRKFVKQHRQAAIQSNLSAVALQALIQKDLTLVGASAIEDKLQDNVKQTIQSLRNAGIKVWMLTGDKLETAINIGYSCGIIDQDMAQLIFNTSISTTLQQRTKYNRDVCLVITGQQLLNVGVQSQPELLHLIHQCKSIIACRVTPKQKQQMVSLLRKSKHTTLAIGDGANDVNMINMAHVGIGIKGVEGAQAAQCSDYAITEFQMVRQLMLYHGRQSYRKNSRLILFNFYKNFVLVLPQLWFGINNGFSSASMFDPWIYQLYNVVYTSLPIIIFAIFDEQFTPQESIKHPKLYQPGILNHSFNLKECLKWFLVPTIQAFFICYFTFYTYQYNLTANGYMMFFASTGMVIFTEGVLICNIKVLIISHEYSIGSNLAVIGSILLFYFTYYAAEKVFPYSSIVNTLQHQLNCVNYYITLFLVVGSMSLADYALTSAHRLFYNQNAKIVEAEGKQGTLVENEMALLKR